MMKSEARTPKWNLSHQREGPGSSKSLDRSLRKGQAELAVADRGGIDEKRFDGRVAPNTKVTLFLGAKPPSIDDIVDGVVMWPIGCLNCGVAKRTSPVFSTTNFDAPVSGSGYN